MAGIAIIKDSFRLYLGADAITELKLADKLSNLVSVGEIGADAEEIDTTCIDSQAKESAGGFDDYGSISIEQNITSTEYTKLRTLRDSKKEVKWAVFADDVDGATVYKEGGKCYVKSVKNGGASVGGLLKVTAELRIVGATTIDITEPIA